MLLAITFASVVSSNTTKSIETKESPLFGIRTRLAIKDRIGDIFQCIKTKFVGNRIFFQPLVWLNFVRNIQEPTSKFHTDNCITCDPQCEDQIKRLKIFLSI